MASDWVIFRGNINSRSHGGRTGVLLPDQHHAGWPLIDVDDQQIHTFVRSLTSTPAKGAVEKPVHFDPGRSQLVHQHRDPVSPWFPTPAVRVTGGGALFNGGTPWWKETARVRVRSVSRAVICCSTTLCSRRFLRSLPTSRASERHRVSGCQQLLRFPSTGSSVVACRWIAVVVTGNFIDPSNNYGAMTNGGGGLRRERRSDQSLAQTISAVAQPRPPRRRSSARARRRGRRQRVVEGKFRLHASFAGMDASSWSHTCPRRCGRVGPVICGTPRISTSGWQRRNELEPLPGRQHDKEKPRGCSPAG